MSPNPPSIDDHLACAGDGQGRRYVWLRRSAVLLGIGLIIAAVIVVWRQHETVNQAICHETAFAAELTEYDDETGRSIQRFYRSQS